MPVSKFRTLDEARRALWTDPGDPGIIVRLKRLGELARPIARPRGVFRYRSIVEAKERKREDRGQPS